jgi:diacylglycerol kinase family enzyme
LRYKSPDVSLILDGRELKVHKMLLLAVGIARYYGSGMMILPNAQIDDGLFDLAWGCDLKMSELSGLMKKIYSGAHVDHPKTTFEKGSVVSATSKVPVPFHLDGDVAGVLPVEFQIKEKAIRIVTSG